jgi:hypothetical protein
MSGWRVRFAATRSDISGNPYRRHAAHRSVVRPVWTAPTLSDQGLFQDNLPIQQFRRVVTPFDALGAIRVRNAQLEYTARVAGLAAQKLPISFKPPEQRIGPRMFIGGCRLPVTGPAATGLL